MAELDPYRSPEADVVRRNPEGTGEKVYKIPHIGLATFLGSPAAGAWLMASNCVALGKPEQRTAMLWLGVVATVFVFITAFVVPLSVPALPFNIVVVIGMLALGNTLQGDALEKYATDEALWHSGRRAAGIGLIFMVGMVVLIAAIVFLAVLFGYENYFFE